MLAKTIEYIIATSAFIIFGIMATAPLLLKYYKKLEREDLKQKELDRQIGDKDINWVN